MRAPGLTRARQTPRVFLVHHSCNGAHALAPQNTTLAACLLPTSGDPRGAASGFDSSIDMYNNDVGKKSAQKIMKQTGDLKAATLYFAS